MNESYTKKDAEDITNTVLDYIDTILLADEEDLKKVDEVVADKFKCLFGHSRKDLGYFGCG